MVEYLQPTIDPRNVQTWPQELAVMKSLRAVPGVFTDGLTIGVDSQGRLTALPGAGGAASWSTITGKPAAIQALSPLVPVNNRLAYFTGPNTAALTELSPYARGLLSDDTAEMARDRLGLGSAAIEDASAFQPADPTLSSIAALLDAPGYLRNDGTGLLSWSEVPDASEATKGILRLATQPMTDAGLDDFTAVTPLKLHGFADNYLVEEAPIDGQKYSRQDGTWTLADTGGTSINADWDWENTPQVGPMTIRRVGIDTATVAAATTVLISTEARDGRNYAAIMRALHVGDALFIWDVADGNSWVRFDVTGTPTDNGTWFSIPVVAEALQGVEPANNANVTVLFAFGAAGVPVATETTAGILELATQPETDGKIDDQRAVTPLKLGATTFLSSKILVDRVAGSTYSTLQHVINTMFSAGIITGGNITVQSATQVRVAEGTGMVRVANDTVSSLPCINWAQTDFTVPADDVVRYFGVIYNGGAPIVEMRSAFTWNKETEIPLGAALRNTGGTIFVSVFRPYRSGDAVTNIIERFDSIAPVQRDNEVGGLIISETGTRQLIVTAGKIWLRLSDFVQPAINTSTGSTFLSAHYNGVAWIYTPGLTQWPNTVYNDVASGLVPITGNRFVNLWFYLGASGGGLRMVYGQAQHVLLADALAESEPGFFPTNLRGFLLLVGKLTFQNGAAVASSLVSPFLGQGLGGAGGGAVSTHNNLGGLQGGIAGEFYHLSAAAHGNIAAATAAAPQFARLGLGVAAEATRSLTVTGVAAITAAGGVQRLLMGNQDGGGTNHPAIIASANGDIAFGSGSSWAGDGGTLATKLILTDAGNVGIGTAAPGRKLDVVADAPGNYVAMFRNSSATAYGVQIQPGTDANPALDILNAAQSANTIRLYGSGNATFAGNVGIGTPSPSYRLHVNGNIAAENAMQVRGTTGQSRMIFVSTEAGGKIYEWYNDVNGPGTFGIYNRTDAKLPIVVSAAGNIGLNNGSPSSALDLNFVEPIVTLTPANYGGSYRTTLGVRSTAEAYLIFGNNAVNEIRAGRTAAGGLLDFYTNNTNDQSLASNGVHVMRMTANGNVGIGTAGPGHKLHVAGDARIDTNLFVYGAFYPYGGIAAYGGIDLYSGAIARFWKADNSTYSQLRYGTSGAWFSTNLGIGTDSPGYQLDVTGRGRMTQGLEVRTTTSTDGYITLAQGSASSQGFIEWYKPGSPPARAGYMGYSATWLADLELRAETGGFRYNGGTFYINDKTAILNDGSATAQLGNVQVGALRTGNRFAVFDLFADDTYTPAVGPALRFIRHNTGANALSQLVHRGTGNMEFVAQEAAIHVFKINNATVCSIRTDGIYNAANVRVVTF